MKMFLFQRRQKAMEVLLTHMMLSSAFLSTSTARRKMPQGFFCINFIFSLNFYKDVTLSV